jgi:hypothetical protein
MAPKAKQTARTAMKAVKKEEGLAKAKAPLCY